MTAYCLLSDAWILYCWDHRLEYHRHVAPRQPRGCGGVRAHESYGNIRVGDSDHPHITTSVVEPSVD